MFFSDISKSQTETFVLLGPKFLNMSLNKSYETARFFQIQVYANPETSSCDKITKFQERDEGPKL